MMQVAPIIVPTPFYGNDAEQAMLARLQGFGPELVVSYLSQNLKSDTYFVGRDAAKRQFPEYLVDPTANNRYADAAASALADAARRTLLAQPIRSGRNQVIILTGCPASGKTGSVGPRFTEKIDFQHETILTSLERTESLIQNVLDAGRYPTIRLFYTDDPRLNVQRMITRARRIGRTIPLPYMAQTYLTVPLLVRDLESTFGSSLTIRVTNNSETPDQAVHHNRLERALYHVTRYTEKSALEAMYAELDELSRASDTVPPAILHEARGVRPNA